MADLEIDKYHRYSIKMLFDMGSDLKKPDFVVEQTT